MQNILFAHLEELKLVYDNLENRNLAMKLKQYYDKFKRKNRRRSAVGRPSERLIPGANPGAFIAVPDPQIKRNIKTAKLTDDTERIKIIRLNFVKRRICENHPDGLWSTGNAIRSVPWGWYWPPVPAPSTSPSSSSSSPSPLETEGSGVRVYIYISRRVFLLYFSLCTISLRCYCY